MSGPNIKGNPLKIFVLLLVLSYFVGEFLIPKYPLIDFINLFGFLGLIISIGIFISGFKLFKSYKEDPLPTSDTKRIIKTGIFAYTRNPIYLAFILFHLFMFLVFENVLYFISSVGLSIWLHNWIVPAEEAYLRKNFSNEYDSYINNVNRWIFF